MYRIFGVIFLFAGMVWTWQAVHSQSVIDTETHAAIQNQLQNYLQQKVIEKYPDSEYIYFPTLWTQTINDHKIKATFEIQYSTKLDPTSQNTIKGELTLFREPSDPQNREIEWRVMEPKLTGQSLEFADGGFVITDKGVLEKGADGVEGNMIIENESAVESTVQQPVEPTATRPTEPTATRPTEPQATPPVEPAATRPAQPAAPPATPPVESDTNPAAGADTTEK